MKTSPPEGFCCWPLSNAVSNAGQRGLSIVLEDRSEGLTFRFQSRGVDAQDAGRAREAEIPVRINLQSTGAILFCPWCGRRLADVAAAAPEVFEQLAARHRLLLPEPL